MSPAFMVVTRADLFLDVLLDVLRSVAWDYTVGRATRSPAVSAQGNPLGVLNISIFYGITHSP